MMNSDLAVRFPQNPLISTKDITPSSPEMEIVGVFNPGVFFYEGKIWLLLRVAERPIQKPGEITSAVRNPDGELEKITFSETDPSLDLTDIRFIRRGNQTFLSSISHLRLLSSYDGVNFESPEGIPSIIPGKGKLESFGIEDCRVSHLGDVYYLTYTQVSDSGVGVGLMSTMDWKNFHRCGMILPPHNKDCALFEEPIGRFYYCFHRPSGIDLGGNYIWLAKSPDLKFWGDHHCLIQTRQGMWDSERIGVGAAPVRTEEGWLVLYHGADENQRYCLGALLLDLKDPATVMARSVEPIMQPSAYYERSGFFDQVIFSNGHYLDGDRLVVYYGASDEVICGATFSLETILSNLKVLA